MQATKSRPGVVIPHGTTSTINRCKDCGELLVVTCTCKKER